MDIDRISQIIEEKKDIFINTSDMIWDYAETSFAEYNSSKLLCDILKQEGFSISEKVAGMDTAFIGSYGNGKPVVAILGEFDALSGLSQHSGVAIKSPVIKDGNGHGCGHNELAAGALAGAVAIKEYLEENRLPGTVRYYGCPAEESGFGKPYLVKEGMFDDVDFALTWHPGSSNFIFNFEMVAVMQVYFRFTGVSAHAGGYPHLGRSALDAMELMHVGINYLREHVIDKARLHYAITNTGGKSPNVVQSEAESYLFIRAPKTSQVKEIYNRVVDIANGAALMTGTKVDIIFDGACSNLIPNYTLSKIMYKNFAKIGPPSFDENEIMLAKEFDATLSEKDKLGDISQNKELQGKVLADIINPYFEINLVLTGSSDVADVSRTVPTAQCVTACSAIGTQFHSWQFVAQAKTPIAHKGILCAGKVIATTALEVMQNPEIIEEAKKELKNRLGGEIYISPIPVDLKPSASR